MRRTDTDRGQAITLEGFIGAMIVLMAILLALQSVVITPTTGGAVDRTVQSQLQQEAKDSLVVAEMTLTDEDGEECGDLSRLIRYFNESGGEFHGTHQSISGEDYHTYNTTTFADLSITGAPGTAETHKFADILNHRFTDQGWNYNLIVAYLDENGDHQTREIVYQGQPNPNAYTASYTLTLFEDQQLLDENGATTGTTIEDSNEYFIPPAAAIPDENYNIDEVYTVVEVRVVVW